MQDGRQLQALRRVYEKRELGQPVYLFPGEVSALLSLAAMIRQCKLNVMEEWILAAIEEELKDTC